MAPNPNKNGPDDRAKAKGKLPDSAFAEPSEPGDHAPEQNPKSQLKGPQEENPQVIASKAGMQAADEKKKDKAKAKAKL